MTDKARTEEILRRRMHGLYLSRPCTDLVRLSRELLGMHSWFYRNVLFSAVIRGAETYGWKTALVKTWLYRGTLHGVAEDELPLLLSLRSEGYIEGRFGAAFLAQFGDEVLRYMEDGVFARAEFRRIFAERYDAEVIDTMFSPWGGIFVYLARRGKVAFRDMTSREFDLINAEPRQTQEEVLPELLRRYLTAYGPATLADAAWFFGFWRAEAKRLRALPMDEYERFELGGKTYYSTPAPDTGDIPQLTLLSGFDPLIVSYTERSAVLPEAYKKRVILTSGICHPTIAINGRVAGIWNIKNNRPTVEFFEPQHKRIQTEAQERVEAILWRTK